MNSFNQSKDINIEEIEDGIKRQIMGYTDDLMLVRVFFKKGAIGYTHNHIHHQISYVESGKFEVEIDNKKKILIKGDAFTVQPHQEHGAVCLEDGILIDTFSPKRDDFLTST
jgi:quercetin dioxygenase-like cupin family protein